MTRRRRQGRVATWVVYAVDTLSHWFPGLLVVGWAFGAYFFVRGPTPLGFLALLLAPYLVPLFLFRLLILVSPIREGASRLAKGVWSPWFVSYRLQVLYGYFPALEGALFSVPGLFNLWLRAWGSSVGRRVFWAATAQITDRGHLVIGNDVFFGNAVYLSPHVVQKRKRRGILYFKKIVVGNDCFVGAGSRMGPGVVVDDGALVPLLTDLYLNARFPRRDEGGS